MCVVSEFSISAAASLCILLMPWRKSFRLLLMTLCLSQDNLSELLQLMKHLSNECCAQVLMLLPRLLPPAALPFHLLWRTTMSHRNATEDKCWDAALSDRPITCFRCLAPSDACTAACTCCPHTDAPAGRHMWHKQRRSISICSPITFTLSLSCTKSSTRCC